MTMRKWLVFLAGASVAIAGAAMGVPNQFQSGQPISAAAANANFDALQAEVEALRASVSDLRPYRIVGATASSFTGAGVGGLDGARQKCEQAYGVGAVMCTGSMAFGHRVAGLPMPTGGGLGDGTTTGCTRSKAYWYMAEALVQAGDNRCFEWNSDANSVFGSSLSCTSAGPFLPSADTCDRALQVLCCRAQ
jgi:hypothetical protein